MLIRFFTTLRQHGLKVTPKEWLVLIEALQARLAGFDLDDFYQLSRLTLVKDETQFDRFDRAFAYFAEGLDALPNPFADVVPDDWLRLELERQFSTEERAAIEATGGIEALLEALDERLNEQDERHEEGHRWIGTAGTSPFGQGGYNPEGVRIGNKGGQRRAVKLWQQRQYRNLDDGVALGTRNLQMALRKLRRFARSGAQQELALDDTIRSTARHAGMLDIKMRPERHNTVKVLLFIDIGGSMDAHVQLCETLFSACRSEFKQLQHFYFHNFIYDHLWTDNRLHRQAVTSLDEVLRTYGSDYKVIFVGDAAMAPYEIAAAYGSIDFMNTEPGAVSFDRLAQHFPSLVWLNPFPERFWDHTQSIGMVRELVDKRMFPLSVDGLERAIASLQGR